MPVFLGGSLFLHLARLFWNQTCTRASLRLSLHASSSLNNGVQSLDQTCTRASLRLSLHTSSYPNKGVQSLISDLHECFTQAQLER